MIYCVVPEPLEGELFEKLTDYYSDDPNVTVIVERRQASRRERGSAPDDGHQRRERRDRRRARVPGELPPLAVE